MAAEIRRSAIYTRKSSDEGLDQSFNSLDAQREACRAYIDSQKGEGWWLIKTPYDDGGYSGGTMDRPALQRLFDDIECGRIDVVVVYKVDRLTRSLADFAKMVELFDQHRVSFVSVTQQFNTTSSMGRLTLNVLLSFAQFEREVTGERIRDKIAASKRKGLWMGGHVPLGYDARDRVLVVNPEEAQLVETIFKRYLELKSVHQLKAWLDHQGHRSKRRVSSSGKTFGGAKFSRGALYALLQNRIYLGQIVHKGECHPGAHPAIIGQSLWEQVQRQLAQNNVDQATRRWAKEPSLLAGLLYDRTGARLTPSHANKNGRRYRYYVSRALTAGRASDSEALRIPAHDIEQVVRVEIQKLLNNEAEIAALLQPIALSPMTSRRLAQRAQQIAIAWYDESPLSQLAYLKRIVRRIVFDGHGLSIEVAKRALVEALDDQTTTELIPAIALKSLRDEAITLNVEVRFRRAHGELRLLIGNLDANNRSASPSAALIKAVARAHVWREHLIAGTATTLADIARRADVTPRYVRELFNLAYLSPRIVEMILAGRQPPELTLDELTANVPIDWRQQERNLEFESLS